MLCLAKALSLGADLPTPFPHSDAVLQSSTSLVFTNLYTIPLLIKQWFQASLSNQRLSTRTCPDYCDSRIADLDILHIHYLTLLRAGQPWIHNSQPHSRSRSRNICTVSTSTSLHYKMTGCSPSQRLVNQPQRQTYHTRWLSTATKP